MEFQIEGIASTGDPADAVMIMSCPFSNFSARDCAVGQAHGLVPCCIGLAWANRGDEKLSDIATGTCSVEADDTPKTLQPCPVCNSPFTAYVRKIPTIRTHRLINLYTCLECESFWNPSGYRESEEQLARDLQWGLGVAERNVKATHDLFAKLSELGVKPKTVAEIGCGIGTLLKTARAMGKSVVGFDVNHRAIEYAVKENRVEAYAAMWSSQTKTIPIDLYLSIMVLEHIDQPRPLIKELCTAAIRHKSALFISVPFADRSRWPNILNPDPKVPGTLFFDNDVHVTHFSKEGLMRAMAEFGITNTRYVAAGLWHGILGTTTS